MRFSEQWLAARLQKEAPKKNQAGDSPADEGPESKLQRTIRDYCADQKWQCHGGSMAHRTRRDSGEEDFVIRASAGRVFFVECKSKTGKLRPEQQTNLQWAAILGHTIHVVDSFQQFLNLVNPTKPCS